MTYKYEDISLGAPLIKLPKFYILLASFKFYPRNINKISRWQISYSVDESGKLKDRIYGCFYNHYLHKYLMNFLQPKVTKLDRYDHIKPIEFAISPVVVKRGYGYKVTVDTIARFANKKIRMFYELYLQNLWKEFNYRNNFNHESWIEKYNNCNQMIMNPVDFENVNKLCLKEFGHDLLRQTWILDRIATVLNKLNRSHK